MRCRSFLASPPTIPTRNAKSILTPRSPRAPPGLQEPVEEGVVPVELGAQRLFEEHVDERGRHDPGDPVAAALDLPERDEDLLVL